MMLDSCAEAIIGVKVEFNKIKQSWEKKETIKGCSHDLSSFSMNEDFVFCPICGRERFKEVIKQNDDLRIKIVHQREFHGLQVAHDGEHLFVVGKLLTTTGSYHADQKPPWFTRIEVGGNNAIKLDDIYKEIHDVLQPLGLWDERQFGIYSILKLD